MEQRGTSQEIAKRVLMTAFQFPPFAGSVAVQRTLRFVQHLPTYGWRPAVLTASTWAYETIDRTSTSEIPASVLVRRAFALDAKRHLGVAGRYPGFLSSPDRWSTWIPWAIMSGLHLVRKFRPAVIWTTYPIPSALRIGSALHRLTGLPWVADFRDPMAQVGYPKDRATWLKYKQIEEDAISNAAFSVFATGDAMEMYRNRYPNLAGRFRVIENGYDEDSFAAVEEKARRSGPLETGRITLLHSGVMYPKERDPTNLFVAMARMRARGLLNPARFRMRFRGAQNVAYLNGLASSVGVLDLIETLPLVPYQQALEEMLRADALVVLADAGFDVQVPAKLFEYLRAGRTIIGLTGPTSSSAKVLRAAGLSYLAPLESAEEIELLLCQVVSDLEAGRAKRPDPNVVRGYSRRARTAELAGLLDAASITTDREQCRPAGVASVGVANSEDLQSDRGGPWKRR